VIKDLLGTTLLTFKNKGSNATTRKRPIFRQAIKNMPAPLGNDSRVSTESVDRGFLGRPSEPRACQAVMLCSLN